VQSTRTQDAIVNAQVQTEPQNPVRGKVGESLLADSSGGTSSPQTVPLKSKSNFLKPLLIVVVLMVTSLLAFLAIKYSPGNLKIPGIGSKGEIVWWGLNEEEAGVNALIAKYQNDNPNVRIIYKKQSSQDYRERLTSSLASGKGPDIFEIHNSWTPMFNSELAPLPSSVMDRSEYSRTFYPVIVNDATSSRGVVAIPLFYDALALFVNEEMFATALEQIPTTWNEFGDTTRKLTQKTGDVILQSGAAIGTTENVDHWQEIVALLMVQNQANLNKPQEDKLKEVLDFYASFSTESTTWNNTLPASTLAFARGDVAMYLGPTIRVPDILQTNPNLRFKTVKLPQLVKNSPADPDYSYATYWMQGVWERSASKEIAWDFLKFISTQASLEALNRSRIYPRPYPRVDMATLQMQDRVLGSVVMLAPQSKSWFLADKTHDGQNGINTQLSSLFEGALRKQNNVSIKNLTNGIMEVLNQYGAVTR